MKKPTVVIAALICTVLSADAQQMVYTWAAAFGSSAMDEGRGIAVDGNGNVLTVGIFEATADLDPGPGTVALISAGNKDVFISKLNSAGELDWAKRIGGANDDYGNAIAVDDQGNSYITGAFTGTVDFDPGDSVRTLTSSGIAYDLFILKLDPSGAYVWAHRIGSTAPDHGNAITVDPFGDVIITGSVLGNSDMDPGAGTELLGAGAFVLKLDNDGVFLWARRLGASGDAGLAVRTDGSGNVYTAGTFSGTNDFDPGAGSSSLTSIGDVDIFVVKLNALGVFSWARSMGGTDLDQVNAIAVDALENVYLTGGFRGTSDFDPGAGTFELVSVNGLDAFTLKLDPTGALVWAFAVGGASFGGSDVGYGIEVDGSGSVFTTGNFLGNVDFDPGAGSSLLNSGSTTNIFIHQVSTDGTFLWAGQVGGGSFNFNSGKAIALHAGAVHVTGSFVSANIDFDPGVGVQPFSAAGGYDAFVLKLQQDQITGVPATAFAQPHLTVYPNPAYDHIRVESETALDHVAILDAAGRTVLRQAIPQAMRISLPLGVLPNGTYVLVTYAENGTPSRTMVLVAR
jgi:hypothetical protein